MTERLAPVPPPYTPEVTSALERLMGGRHDVAPLALFRTLARHEPMLERFRQVGSTLLSFGRLPAADRELLIHRTTARCGAAYEWGVHAALFAPALGLGDEWLQATWDGAPDDFPQPRQRLLARACDELHDTAALSDATYAALAGLYDDDQLVELVCVAGFYHLVSFLCGAFAVAPEPWAVTPPAQ